jgi:hypothetical protein
MTVSYWILFVAFVKDLLKFVVVTWEAFEVFPDIKHHIILASFDHF